MQLDKYNAGFEDNEQKNFEKNLTFYKCSMPVKPEKNLSTNIS